MKKMIICLVVLALSMSACQQKQAEQQGKSKSESYSLPPNNPYLIQNSVYPSVHFNTAQSDVTQQPSWTENITVNDENVQWLPWVTSIGTAHLPYKSGEEALFVAGTNKVGKIRITDGDFSWVDELMIPGFEYETPTAEQIARTVEEMMAAGDDEERYLASYSKHVKAIQQSSANIAFGIYSLMDHEGNFYVGWET